MLSSRSIRNDSITWQPQVKPGSRVPENPIFWSRTNLVDLVVDKLKCQSPQNRNTIFVSHPKGTSVNVYRPRSEGYVFSLSVNRATPPPPHQVKVREGGGPPKVKVREGGSPQGQGPGRGPPKVKVWNGPPQVKVREGGPPQVKVWEGGPPGQGLGQGPEGAPRPGQGWTKKGQICGQGNGQNFGQKIGYNFGNSISVKS